MNNLQQIIVEPLSLDDYQGFLRNKWQLYNTRLSETAWNAAKKCILLQEKYTSEDKVRPLVFTLDDKSYVFLEIVQSAFESVEEKTQFMKEIRFLKTIESSIFSEEALDLVTHFGDYQNQNSESLFLTQVFFKK